MLETYWQMMVTVFNPPLRYSGLERLGPRFHLTYETQALVCQVVDCFGRQATRHVLDARHGSLIAQKAA